MIPAPLPWLLRILIFSGLRCVSSFLHYDGMPHKQQRRAHNTRVPFSKIELSKSNPSPNTSENSVGEEVTLDAFDFSSRKGWDDFYSRDRIFEFEWHSSVSHEMIVSEIDSNGSSVLMVGTGNSVLPRILYDAHEGRTSVVCLDYSQPCLDMLRTMHAESCPRMEFICGNAKELEQIFSRDANYIDGEEEEGGDPNDELFYFDTIVDKGLVDAFMCGEGWNGDLEPYMKGVAALLEKGIGRFILVSYKLNSSTKEFLIEIGRRHGLQWEFDVQSKSNSRVSFSVGHKV